MLVWQCSPERYRYVGVAFFLGQMWMSESIIKTVDLINRVGHRPTSMIQRIVSMSPEAKRQRASGRISPKIRPHIFRQRLLKFCVRFRDGASERATLDASCFPTRALPRPTKPTFPAAT